MILKGNRVTSVKITSSDSIISWSDKTALFRVVLLVSQPVKLQTPIYFTGRTYWNFFVTMDTNVNKLLRLESMTSAMPQIM